MKTVVRIASLALFLAASLAFSQSLAVNGPFDPAKYKPLTGRERWHRWLSEDGASPAIHVQSLSAAAYTQFIGDPTVWPRTTAGYLRRAGSSYGGNLIQNSLHEGLGAAEGTDPRYFACVCKGFGPRFGHAVKMTFFTYNRAGKVKLDLPQLTGVYGSSMIAALWWPSNTSALVQGVQAGHIGLSFIGATHLVQEFSPELKRFFHVKSSPAATTRP